MSSLDPMPGAGFGAYPDRVDGLRRGLVSSRDELLAAGLLAFALAELLLGEDYQGRAAWAGPMWAGLLQVALLTVPLAWRRRAPLASSLSILVAVAASSLLWGAAESTAAFLSILLTVFSGTAHARRPRLVVLAASASLAVHNLRDPSVATVVDWFWSAGFLAVAVLLAIAVRTRQLRIVALQEDAEILSGEYDERVAAATAAERAAIARELHDVVAHAVSVIVIQAQAGSRAVEDDAATARELLNTIESTGRSALADLRRLLRLLSTDDPPVDPSPGLAHLDSLVAGFQGTGLEVSVLLPDPLPTLSGAADLAAYRLVQEALTNTLRHAAATRVSIRVAVQAAALEITVEDDGQASHPSQTTDGSGRGLIGMRERVMMAGGSLLEACSTGHGFRVRAQLPRDTAGQKTLETAP